MDALDTMILRYITILIWLNIILQNHLPFDNNYTCQPVYSYMAAKTVSYFKHISLCLYMITLYIVQE